MGLREYELQWQSILSDNMFAEEAVISDDETFALNVKGVFFSGSYGENSASAYAPRRLVAREFFKMSSLYVPEEITQPWSTFEGLTLTLTERGISFRISEVSGKRGGDFTFELQERSDG